MRKDVESAFDEAVKDVTPLKKSFKDLQDMVDRYGYYKEKTNDEFKEEYKKASARDSELYENTRQKVFNVLQKQGKEYLKNVDANDMNWLLTKDGEQFYFAFGDVYDKRVSESALSEYRKEHPDRG